MDDYEIEVGDTVREISTGREMKVYKRLTNIAHVVVGLFKKPRKNIQSEFVAAVGCEWYENGKKVRGNFKDSKLRLVKKKN